MRVYIYEPWRQVDGLPPVLYSKEMENPAPKYLVQPPASAVTAAVPAPSAVAPRRLAWGVEETTREPRGMVGGLNCGCRTCYNARMGMTPDSIEPLTGIDLTDSNGTTTAPLNPPAMISPETEEVLLAELQTYSGMPNTPEMRNVIMETSVNLLGSGNWSASPPTYGHGGSYGYGLGYRIPERAPAPPSGLWSRRPAAAPMQSLTSPVELELKTYSSKKTGKTVYVYQPVGMLSKGALAMAMATELALDAQKEVQ